MAGVWPLQIKMCVSGEQVLGDSGKIDQPGMRLSCAMEKVPVAMEAEQISVSR